MLKRNLVNRFVGILGLSVLAVLGTATAEPLSCPKSVATVEQDDTTQIALERVVGVYETLGCETEFVPLPAARGIIHFNNGLVDGELFRLRQVEPSYTRDVVRSTEPVMILSSVVWLHPELHTSERLPLGYLIGVVWQQAYMEGSEGRAFRRSHDMFEAYNRGELRGFLANHVSVETYHQNHAFTLHPQQGEVVSREPVYHYLAAEYAPFIKVFSKTLHDRLAQQGGKR